MLPYIFVNISIFVHLSICIFFALKYTLNSLLFSCDVVLSIYILDMLSDIYINFQSVQQRYPAMICSSQQEVEDNVVVVGLSSGVKMI